MIYFTRRIRLLRKILAIKMISLTEVRAVCLILKPASSHWHSFVKGDNFPSYEVLDQCLEDLSWLDAEGP